MKRLRAIGIAVGVLLIVVLACGPLPTTQPTSAPPPTERPTEQPTQPPAATATPETGGDAGKGGGVQPTPEVGGGKGGGEPTATPPAGSEPGGGKGGGGSAGRTATLTLVNNSSQTVCYVYISPTTDDSWGNDWLGGSETISAGSSRAFQVSGGSYDLRADDCNNNSLYEQYAVSVAGSMNWTITSGGPSTVNLTLVNNSSQSVCYVYISPTTDTSWGNDWLSQSETIASGSSRAFQVTPGSYDLRADDCNNNTLDTESAVDVSSDADWTLSPVGGSANLTVINNTSTSVWYVYISPSSSSEWGDDWLGSSTLGPGASYTFQVTEGTYDLKAEDQNHNVVATQFNQYISGDKQWTLSSSGGGGGVTLTLVNNSGQTVCYVYISPSDSSSWGADWLGSSETLASGSSRTFQVSAGTYDLKAEDCNHNIVGQQYAVSISGAMDWTLSGTGGGGGATSLTIYNQTSTDIWYVYISPSTSSTWGDDQLGSSTIPAGGSYTFNVTAGSYDLKAENSSHNVLATWMDVYISGAFTWTVTQ